MTILTPLSSTYTRFSLGISAIVAKYSFLFSSDLSEYKKVFFSCYFQLLKHMENYKNPLHIISAHVAELGITLASRNVDGRSNEIPALRQLLEALSVEGCIIVADALHCQKETAAVVVKKQVDYLLSVKDN